MSPSSRTPAHSDEGASAPAAAAPAEFSGPGGVFARELLHVRERRRRVNGLFVGGSEAGVDNNNTTTSPQKGNDKPEAGDKAAGEADPDTMRERGDLLGLAISGGGIRSATFGLGVLQALAETGLLRRVDYLSTVSGGGYIGSWLVAWIKALDEKAEADAKAGKAGTTLPGIRRVEERLRTPGGGGGSIEAPELRKLRAYSNYLSPNPGLFSADTWTVAAIWARNMLVNLVLLICLNAAVLLLPRLCLIPLTSDWFEASGWGFFWAVTASLLGLAPVAWIVQRAAPQPGQAARPGLEDHSQKPALVGALCLLGSAYFASIAMWNRGNPPVAMSFALAGVLAVGCTMMLWLRARGAHRRKRLIGAFVVSGLVGLGAASLFHLYLQTLGPGVPGAATHLVIAGPPAVLLLFATTMAMATGVMGNCIGDHFREWLGRLGAWVLIVMGFSFVLWLIAFHGLLWVGLAMQQMAVIGSLGAGWLLSAVVATVGGWSARSSGTGSSKSSRLEWVLAIAPHVFVVGLAVVLSAAIGWGLLLGEPVIGFDEARYWPQQEGISGWVTAAGIAGFALLGLLLGWLIDINEFSMHYLYRNRLVRCYLGASRYYRNPNQVTDFDPDDDRALATFASRYSGPYPLINAALNVSNPDPGQRERRSTNFTFAPLFCGYHLEDFKASAGGRRVRDGHYRPTAAYAKVGSDNDEGVNLGMAFTISGAAATPNMGSHTSAPLAFLMTIFNVRLGWWIGNPAGGSWRRMAPVFGLWQLVKELLAMADGKSGYVYLSDGGHFENLAVYELLRRRCQFVIACDGSQDEGFRFDDLGGLVRKARADFGIEIVLDTSAISERDQNGLSQAHCAVGLIRYPEGRTGTLLYIKGSLTGDEDTDVLQYRSKHSEFPHQTTGDQFFSESQFESYRKLGHHSAREALQPALTGERPETEDLRSFFLQLRQAWMGTPEELEVNSGRHSAALGELMGRLSREEELRFLDAQFYPEWRQVREGAASQRDWWPHREGHFARAFYFCQALVHLMEQVYTDLNLQRNFEHPICRGWMNRFMHWAGSDMFRLTYAMTACTFDGRFQNFCERNLQLAPAPGALRVSEARWPEDADNFNEYEMEFMKVARSKFPEWRIWQVEQSVTPMFSGAPRKRWTYTVGFAFTEPVDEAAGSHRLVWIRVQNHLRAAGIGRKAIEALQVAVGGGVLIAQPPQDRNEVPGLFEAESERHIDWVDRVTKGLVMTLPTPLPASVAPVQPVDAPLPPDDASAAAAAAAAASTPTSPNTGL